MRTYPLWFRADRPATWLPEGLARGPLLHGWQLRFFELPKRHLAESSNQLN